MLTFFRRIRKGFLESGATRKYLFYAIGEIALVVIGILIALQVNNWNENRKDKAAEMEYYCKLLDDFELDRINIDKRYKESEHKIAASKKLLIDLNNKNKDKSYIMNTYIQALRTNAYVPSKTTITDLTSSGNLNLLKNDLLKISLIRYYAELDNLLMQLEINRSKSLERAFAYDDDIQVGFQYLDYVKVALGKEIFDILPMNNWHLDSNNKYFRQIQNDLVNFVTNSEREKQHFTQILTSMEHTYSLLHELCQSN